MLLRELIATLQPRFKNYCPRPRPMPRVLPVITMVFMAFSCACDLVPRGALPALNIPEASRDKFLVDDRDPVNGNTAHEKSLFKHLADSLEHFFALLGRRVCRHHARGSILIGRKLDQYFFEIRMLAINQFAAPLDLAATVGAFNPDKLIVPVKAHKGVGLNRARFSVFIS